LYDTLLVDADLFIIEQTNGAEWQQCLLDVYNKIKTKKHVLEIRIMEAAEESLFCQDALLLNGLPRL
jgi:hypothetical protein